jgi:hypothetical protein
MGQTILVKDVRDLYPQPIRRFCVGNRDFDSIFEAKIFIRIQYGGI